MSVNKDLFVEKLRSLFSEESDPLKRAISIHDFLTFFRGIITSKVTGEVFFYLLEHGACTAWILQVLLEQPEASIYAALKRLRKLELIVPVTKLIKSRHSAGGPRAAVWALIGAGEEAVADAVRLHYRSLNPKYRVAEELMQTVLKDYLGSGTEIIYRELLAQLRKNKPLYRPYTTPDVGQLISVILREKGIKVWR